MLLTIKITGLFDLEVNDQCLRFLHRGSFRENMACKATTVDLVLQGISNHALK